MTNPSASSPPGLLVVISGPSGVGKTTIVHEVVQRTGGVFSVSATTRPRGQNEIEGRDYFFVSEPRFRRMLENGEFLEYAQVFGRHWYGTPRRPIEELLGQGTLIVLDIDVQGAKQVKNAMPEAFAIFILPPSENELLRRLRARARDDEESIQRRFAEAREEIAFAQGSGCYDAFIINDELEDSIRKTCALIDEWRRDTSTDANRAASQPNQK